jgi:hypothetical protein
LTKNDTPREWTHIPATYKDAEKWGLLSMSSWETHGSRTQVVWFLYQLFTLKTPRTRPLFRALPHLFCLPPRCEEISTGPTRIRSHHDNASSGTDIEGYLHLGRRSLRTSCSLPLFNLCSMSVPLRFYLCYISDHISLSLFFFFCMMVY